MRSAAGASGYTGRGVASYSLAETARILNVSPSRLRYWERTALVRAHAGEGAGPSFGFQELVSLRRLVRLLERGVPLRRIRTSVARLQERIPELEQPLGALRAWPFSASRVVVRHGDAWLEPDGQLVLDFAAVAGAAAVAALPAPDAADAPRSALGWFERGCELDAEAEESEAAAGAYRRAIALDPEFADAHCNLGTIHYNRGDREAARRHYEAAVDIDPGHLEANFNLGSLSEEEGRREAALRHYKLALRADPLFPEAHLNLALLYEKLQLSRSARDHWRRYLQLVPDGSWAEIARDRLRDGPPRGG